MIEKVKTEGIYIPEGDVQGAAEFVAMRNNQKQEAYLQIFDEGMKALNKEKEAKHVISRTISINNKNTTHPNNASSLFLKFRRLFILHIIF